MSQSMYHGGCSCGNIKFHCEGKPSFTQYCHCNKCREIANMSTLDEDKRDYAWTAAYETSKVHITVGNLDVDIRGDNPGVFLEEKRNNSKLMLCPSCRNLIYGISMDPAKQVGIGVNAYKMKLPSPTPPCFAPDKHVYYANRKVSIKDGLPKFEDAPVDQGGLGRLWMGVHEEQNDEKSVLIQKIRSRM